MTGRSLSVLQKITMSAQMKLPPVGAVRGIQWPGNLS